MYFRRPRVFVAAFALLVVVALSACQGQQAAPVAPTSAPATKAATIATQVVPAATSAPAATAAATSAAPVPAVAPETFKIGISHALTGPVSGSAAKGVKSMQMAFDDWNAKGGVKVGNKTYLAQAVVADDKFTSEGGLEACNRLVLAEKVKLIVGVSTAGPLTTCQPIAEQAKVPIITLGSGVAANFGTAHPLTLSAGSSLALPRIVALQKWLVKNHPQAKRVAFLGADNASGRNEAATAEQVAKELGLTVVPVYFPEATKDFSPMITRVLGEKPDAIQLPGAVAASGPQFLSIAKSLSEQNWKGPFFGAYANTSLPQAGAAAEGFVFPILMDYNSPLLPQVGKDLSNRFIQKYSREDYDESQFLNQYITPWVSLQGIEKAGTVDDAAKIVDTLRAGQWDTTYGKVGFGGTKTFGLNVILEVPIFLGKVEGGKLVTFEVVPGTIP